MASLITVPGSVDSVDIPQVVINLHKAAASDIESMQADAATLTSNLARTTWQSDVAPGAYTDLDAAFGFTPASWADQVAGYDPIVQATVANQPSASTLNGRPAVYFNGSAVKRMQDNDATTAAEYTWVVAFAPDTSQTAVLANVIGNYAWGAPGGGTATLLGMTSARRITVYQAQVTPDVQLEATKGPVLALNTPVVLTFAVRGARRYMYLNGVLETSDLTDQSNLTTKLARWDGDINGASQFGGYLFRSIRVASAWPRRKQIATEMALLGYLGVVLPSALIYMDGDSYGASATSTLQAHTQDAITARTSKTYRIVEVAISGSKAVEMAARAPYRIAPGYNPVFSHNVAVLLQQHNSVKDNARSASQVLQDIADWYTVCRNAGFAADHIFVGTNVQSSALDPYAVKLATVNAGILSAYGAQAVDFASIVGMTYADADHPDDAGYTLMGTMLGAALAALIA